MSETQGTAAPTTGTTGDVQGRPQNTGKNPGAGKSPGEISGGSAKIQQALSGAAPSPSATKEGAQETPKEAPSTKIKLKIYGKERELDFSDPEHRQEIQRRLQMDVAAEQRLQQARDIERKYEQSREIGKKDYEALLRENGHDPIEAAKALIAKQIQQEMMDPRERQLMEERAKREALEKQNKDRETNERTQYEQALRQHKAKEYETNILSELGKVDLPTTPGFVRLIAQNLLDAKNNKIEMSVAEATQASRAQAIEVVGDLLGGFSVPQIAKHFGQGFIDKIRSHAIDELQAPLKQGFNKPPSAKPSAEYTQNRERKWKSWSEKQEELERRART